MRHYEIGRLEFKEGTWSLSFFRNKLKKIFKNIKSAKEFANKELKKFVDFAGEGATYRIIKDGSVIFHQNDIEEDGYEEYDVTYDEYFYTHFFYASEDDKKNLGKFKEKANRNSQQEKWYQEEVQKTKNTIVKYSAEEIISIAKKLIEEMSQKEKEYIKKIKL